MSVTLIVLAASLFIGLAGGSLAARRERRLPWAFLLLVVGLSAIGMAFLDAGAGIPALAVGLVAIAAATILAHRPRTAP